ncbi:hypothetical protein A9Q99_14030 [Gammaproteobacteria bacterium 45_16_T64]|nr:hypothetical protein A9Q99_14030 [Gammaproteobacteria bacterium 45_16_T64]
MTKVGHNTWRGSFSSMASPCEILINCTRRQHAESLVECAYREAKRIESKFSRYQEDNIIFRINNSQGEWVSLDTETTEILKFADQLFQVSEGLFDISSGVLRRIWNFQTHSSIPTQGMIDNMLPLIGWDKITFDSDNQRILLPMGMEIDLGGIGKEYAVDLTLKKIQQMSDSLGIAHGSYLVNFGGDIVCSHKTKDKNKQSESPWVIGIETIDSLKTAPAIELVAGGLATSGDSRRHIDHEDKRYSHIVNPKTGWPIEHAPHSVTVIANTCLEAGMLATLASLQGRDCENMLIDSNTCYWIQ